MANAKGKRFETGTKITIILLAILCAILIAIIVWVIWDVCRSQLNEEWMIGKTVDEITQRYGEFYGKGPTLEEHSECTPNNPNHKALYIAKEKKVGFFGTDPAEYIRISFDCKGVCIKTERLDGAKGG